MNPFMVLSTTFLKCWTAVAQVAQRRQMKQLFRYDLSPVTVPTAAEIAIKLNTLASVGFAGAGSSILDAEYAGDLS